MICPAYCGILMGMPQWWTGGPFDNHQLAKEFIRELEWAIWVSSYPGT